MGGGSCAPDTCGISDAIARVRERMRRQLSMISRVLWW